MSEHAHTFSGVTRAALLNAERALGLKEDTATRELDRMVQHIVPAADKLMAAIEAEPWPGSSFASGGQ